ncbi:MAG: acyl-CoA thioesterase [Saprospiraceae bacterium]|nr:acyl-CoA thioesterase [Saprospiraceae bacterium]
MAIFLPNIKPISHDFRKTPSTTYTVKFTDCDPYGHLNNARYLDYCLNAREDQLEKFYGINIFEASKKSHFGWVVYGHQIIYISPAIYREEVRIQSRIIEAHPKALIVEFIMYNHHSHAPKCLLWTTLSTTIWLLAKAHPSPTSGKNSSKKPFFPSIPVALKSV